jgi:uncharacterized RDD family membrane protein YckC
VDDERTQIDPSAEAEAERPSMLGPVGRVGWRGVRGVARRLGLDRVVGGAVDRGVDRAIDSEAAARATQRVLDSDTAKRVWGKVLESEQAQQLVERVAEAPEVRAAIAAQGVGVLEDLRRGVRSAGRRLDDGVERVARKILRRPVREHRPIYAGAVTRLVALAIDAGVVYGGLLLVSAAIALLVSILSSGDESANTIVIALGAFVWAVIAGAYLVLFWSGAGRTPGMNFLGLRMLSPDGEGVSPGQAVRRLIWMVIAALPFGLGFWGILFEERRCAWPDRRADTRVLYADPDLDRQPEN